MKRLQLLMSLSALTWLALLTQSGCFDDARACAQSQDCFVGEACIDQICAEPSIEDNNRPDPPKDGSPDTPDARPDVPISPDEPADNLCEREGKGILCGEACVDPLNDRSHCGGCDRACGDEEKCFEGECIDPDGFCREDSDCPDVGVGKSFCEDNRCVTKCDDDAMMCGGVCAACPQGDGVRNIKCEDTRCVVRRCVSGFEICANGDRCCPIDPDRCTSELEPLVRMLGTLNGTPSATFVQAGEEVEVKVIDSQNRPWADIDVSLNAPVNSFAVLSPSPQGALGVYTFKADVPGNYTVRAFLYDAVGLPSCEQGRADVRAF